MLVVVDSSKKVSILRAIFPEAKVANIDFPLYTRFKRGKVRLDSFPALKPAATAEITRLQKLAHGVDVLGIFDNTTYGRVQARDLVEALSDLNNTVAFKFVDAYVPEVIEEAQLQGSVDSDCDVKYVINRFVSAAIDELLLEYCGDGSELSCSWQQALLLSRVVESVKDPEKVHEFVDSIGRTYTGKYDPSKPVHASVREVVVSVPRRSVLDLVGPNIELEDVYPALDRLKSSGLIAVAPMAIPPDLASVEDAALAHLQSLSVVTGADASSAGYFVTDMAKEPGRIPESDIVKRVYEKILAETYLAVCGPVRARAVTGTVHGLSFACFSAGLHWLNLADKATFNECGPVVPDPDKVVEKLRFHGALNTTLKDVADEAGFTDRDLWSACSYLISKHLVVRRGDIYYPTSRGLVVHYVLEHVFPAALSTDLAKFISNTVEDHLRETNNTLVLQQEITLSKVHEYLAAEIADLDLSTLWDGFAGLPTEADVHVSAHACWIVHQGSDHGLALSGGDIVAVPVDEELRDPCPCGAGVVNTALSPTYESIVECPSCKLKRPLVFFHESE